MTDTKKRRDGQLGLADAADRIAKVLATAAERRHKALEKADADEVVAIQTALDKLVARVPADLRGKLVSVLAAMDVEVDAPFVVTTSATPEPPILEPEPPSARTHFANEETRMPAAASADELPAGARPYVPGAAARAARGR